MARTTTKPKKQSSHWFILVLLALAQFMVVLDVSIVNVALPTMQKAFHLSAGNLQWVVTAYALTFGGFLLLGGRTADLFGRRRTFLTGVTMFTLASLGTGLSQSGTMLIVFRALQGLSGAFMSPSALSIVLVTYREGHERNVALSVWGAVASGGAAVGVLAGGVITQYLTWRWNFFVNIPVGIFVVVTALRILDQHKTDPGHNTLDVAGAVSVTGGLMVLVYGLVKAPTYGWTDHKTLIFFGISLFLLVFFIINESRIKHPLMPLRIFKIRNVAGADTIMLLQAAGLYSVFFFTTLYMQEILGYSPVKTGLSFLLIPIIIAITATNVPKVIQRIGYKPILMIAPLFVSGGLFWISHLPVHGSYWKDLAPGLALMGFGMGATFVSATIGGTTGVPPSESGLASGLINTSQQIGGSLGLAVLTGVSTSAAAKYIHNLNLSGVPSKLTTTTATVHGFHEGYLVASTFGIAAALVATIVIQRQKAKSDPSHGEAIASAVA
jgi:EmrB/QacA subfamily drug resistance transporter